MAREARRLLLSLGRSRRARCSGLGALVAALALATPVSATFPGANGRIAVVVGDSPGQGGDIVLIDPAGGGTTVGTVAAGFQAWTWAPAGDSIVFTRFGASEVFAMKPDGTGAHAIATITGGSASEPAISPDGTEVVVVRGDGSLLVVDADGSGMRTLVPKTSLVGGVSANRPSWSPDGTMIAFTGCPDAFPAPCPLLLANAASGVLSPLSAPDRTAIEPDWAPAGDEVAYLAFESGGPAEVRVTTIGGPTAGITRVLALPSAPRFSPDGTKIAYLAGGGTTIEVADVTGAGASTVFRTTRRILEGPDWVPSADTDGDGLLDDWETQPIDTDGDGMPDLDLPAMGADPMHKDVFVEIDPMQFHRIDQLAVDTVVAAFRDAPVPNPDGTMGIVLHVDNGPGSVMNPLTGESWGMLSDQDVVAHKPVLGTQVGDTYDWSEVDTIKQALFSPSRQRAFHYVVSAHQYGSSTNTSSGLSRGTPASDLILALGPACAAGDCSGTTADQAGTFMHELGHNLGLRHGGTDDRNRKPNYLSIMRYGFQFTGIPKGPDLSNAIFDYSRFGPESIKPIDETALDEATGLVSGNATVGGFTTLYRCPDGTDVPATFLGPIDWDCSGVPPAGVVMTDVNHDGMLTGLDPVEDWSRLAYDGGAIGDAGASVTLETTTKLIELPIEEHLASARALTGDDRPPKIKLQVRARGRAVRVLVRARDDRGVERIVVIAGDEQQQIVSKAPHPKRTRAKLRLARGVREIRAQALDATSNASRVVRRRVRG